MRCTETMRILEIMRLSEQGFTQREIGASVNCGKSTVGDIQRRFREVLLQRTKHIFRMRHIRLVVLPYVITHHRYCMF